MVSNLKEAKELLEKYKSITLEQLEEAYKENPYACGEKVMCNITGFGKVDSCIICSAVNNRCNRCIYSFRMKEAEDVPCLDIIYNEMCDAKNSEELYSAIQKRISYLTHIIEWYENSN